MSDASTLLAALKAARLACVQKMASGQFITEYRDGNVSVRKSSPVDLLKELDRQIQAQEVLVASEGNERQAAVGCFGGAS